MPSGLGNPQRRCRFGEPLFLETPKHRKLCVNIAFLGIRRAASWQLCTTTPPPQSPRININFPQCIRNDNIMRLATEIEFAKGFACAAPAMYRNFSVIAMYSVMSMCSACNVSQLQCNYNVSVRSAYHILQLQCNYSVATLCSACVSQLHCRAV